MRSPRALFCTDTYPPQVNGVSVVTALSVAGLMARGWECLVVAPRYPAGLIDAFTPGGRAFAPESIPTAPVIALPSAPLPFYPDLRLSVPNYGAIRRAIADFRPDIVHVETEFVLGALGQRAARRAGIPVVSSYHTDFSRYAAAYGLARLRPAIASYLARFHQRCRRTYTPSASARSDLLRLGVRDVEVWGRGVDLHAFSPSRRSDPVREQYGGPDTFLLLHVGRLAAEKGVERILEGYRLARAQLPAARVHLIIAGDGPRQSALRAAAPDGVTFLGLLDRQHALPRLYASCDAFVFSSLTETLGLVILEAMASGLPVIATPAGGVGDHLRDGENGLAYPAGDTRQLAHAIVSLVLDRSRARALADGALRTATALSWDAELDRLDLSYREISGAPLGAPALARAG